MILETIFNIFILIIYLNGIYFFTKLLITKKYKVELFNLNYEKNTNIIEMSISLVILLGLVIISITTIQTILFDFFKVNFLK
jgi:hypothetical protein